MIQNKIKNALLTLSGSLFVILGFIGIFLPGLPTTPFLLLAACCYVNSSPTRHKWLLEHRIFGKYIGEFERNGTISFPSKMIAVSLMLVMCILSVVFFIENVHVDAIVIIAGTTGAAVVVSFPSSKVT